MCLIKKNNKKQALEEERKAGIFIVEFGGLDGNVVRDQKRLVHGGKNFDFLP